MAIDFDLLVNRPNIAILGNATALIQRAGFDDIEVRGIFDSRHFAVDDIGHSGGSALVTTFEFRIADLSAAALGLDYIVPSDTLFTVRETAYRMVDLRPDSEGMAVIQLERADA